MHNEHRSGGQAVDHLDETIEQCRLVRFPAGRELRLSSEVATGRRGGDALLCHGVDRHTGTTQCADHPDRAVMDRVMADPDEEDRQTTVEGWGRGRTAITPSADDRARRRWCALPAHVAMVVLSGSSDSLTASASAKGACRKTCDRER